MKCFKTATRASLFLSLVLVLVACSSDNDSGSTAAGSTAQTTEDGSAFDTNSELTGTWDFCGQNPNTSTRFTYVFEGQRYRYSYAVFGASDCSGEPSTAIELYAGPYELLARSTDSSGVAIREINLTVDTVSGINAPEASQWTVYTIMSLSDTEVLYLNTPGEFEPADRPTALDFEQPFMRRQ